jgi:hypothetical protein
MNFQSFRFVHFGSLVRPVAGIALLLVTQGLIDPLARGQQGPMQKPATVDEAAKNLDLRSFPLEPGAKDPGGRRLASLYYESKGSVKKVYDNQRKLLVERGWKEQPNSYISDESASGTFAKNGFVTSMSVSASGGPENGTVQIMIQQHGNVNMAKLPIPQGAKTTYTGPTTAMFVTDDDREKTAQFCRERLVAQGWLPYGTAGDSLIFKQNAVELNTMISSAPAQGGKTMIQYSAQLMSVDLPPPPDPVRAHYADSTKDLEFDVKSEPEALVAYYMKELGKAGWKPTTEQPILDGTHHMIIFRNSTHDMMTLEFNAVDNLLRGTLKHLSAAEVEEMDRRAKAASARAKANARRRGEPTAKPVVKLSLPADAKEIHQDGGDLKFVVAAGKAKSTVESLRNSLREAGWEVEASSLEKIAGVVSLAKKGSGSVTINYTDTGVKPAEVSITGFGVVVEQER